MSSFIPKVLEEINAGAGVKLSAAARRYDDHPATWHRWALKGLLQPDGTRVKLEAVMIGSSWFTSEPAIARFIASRTAKGSEQPMPPTRTQAQRRTASERAAERLQRIGV